MYIYDVYVTNASLNVNKPFTYYYDDLIDNYKRVNIIFNRKKVQGIIVSNRKIISLKDEEIKLGFKISSIQSVIDKEPILNESQFELAKYISYNTVSPLISCLNVMIPKALKISKKESNIVFKEYIKKIKKDSSILTLKQQEIYKKIEDNMLLSDARKLSISIVNKLIALGYLEKYSKEKEFVETEFEEHEQFKELTSDQKDAYNGFLSTDKNISLLFGVTGSGKTEVYLHLAREYLKQNKNVLVLVPEIGLTPQMIKRVKQRFNDAIFYHSELNNQERYEQYKRVKSNDVKIVVGTRSSIFLPFKDLGLIIVDEEHDQSYKQDSTPCYNVKDIAFWLAKQNNAKVLLASATPSLESYSRALKGDYALFELKNRINNTLPSIEIVNLTCEIKNKRNNIISSKLFNELQNTIDNNKQAIILLNRRGYQPIVRCKECGTVLTCKNCDIPLSYHSDKKIFKCHQCSQEYKVVELCPQCHNKSLTYYGFGTMKVEEELKKVLPNAKIIRMDADSTSKKGSHKRILDDFGNKKYNILVGTQMISKGLDYPDVTLVGILNADAGLLHQDYNSAKTTLDLLMQASGRSGRSNNKGKVIIQTYNVDHYVIKTVINQDYTYFFNVEMNYRNKTGYPPYSHLLEIIVSNLNETKCSSTTEQIYKELFNKNIKMYKPYALRKLSNFYRQRIVLIDKSKKRLLDATWDVINKQLNNKNNSRITVDVDPLYLE